MTNIHESWNPIKGLLYQEPLSTLNQTILPEIYYHPEAKNIFNVFQMPVNDIKVVILGQDPYPTPGDAIGRAFAINKNKKIPVSLRNIHAEISMNFIDEDGNKESDELHESFYLNNKDWVTLEHWQEQGVFLLNTALTVESGKAGSHLKYWEDFTKRVISHISNTQPCIWLLWGKKAEMFKPYINNIFNVQGYDSETIESIPINSDWNYVLTAPHPAAEAYSGGKAGFFGSNHFKYTNSILKQMNNKEIKW